ncbi:hypothetical protein AGDE_15725 [Angomonas deanei]|nr:hypothetical protein AGDE_15725 [Angomonas deanei]|eukprot:EPY18570.1 hypothetical protein AGDE_15725 [Angomonas deanei]
MWILLETVYNALGTILGIVIIWMLVAMGLCVCCILIFGEATAEFSTIASSYGTLILMYIDRGKWLFTDVGWNTGTTDFSTTVPSAVGTLLDQDQPFLHAYVRGKMFSTSVSLFQLVLYTFIFLFVFLVNSWTIAVLAESYERVSARRKSVLWGTTESFRRVYRGLRRSMSIEYLTESARRMLWARQTEQLYADMEKTIQDSLRQRNADLNSKLTYTSLLWLLPRELQAEMGPCHLRKLWLSCADYVETLTRHDTNALAQQWRQHWEKCEDGIQGWLLSVMPKEVELETKSVEVGILLDELPPKIVNYVERFGS